MATPETIRRLRAYLADPSPSPDGQDPFFSEEDVLDLLTFQGNSVDTQANLYQAAAEGWDRKASAYAELASQQTGGSQRTMSDLYTHAKDRVEHFRLLGNRRESTRVGTIRRPGTTIL